MKKRFALMVAAALMLAGLVGCGGRASDTGKTPEELGRLYADAISAHGGEMAEYNPVISEYSEENAIQLEVMGLNGEDVTAFGVSTSMMNVKAYAIAAVMPAEGRETAVKEALQSFVDQKQREFEHYLPDQYEVARNARLETLEDGTVLLVMTENGDVVFERIAAAIREG